MIFSILVIFNGCNGESNGPINSNREESCVEVNGTAVPIEVISGKMAVDNLLLVNNMWGIRGHKNNNFKQCLFIEGDELGWTWRKGTTDPVCSAPPGQSCQEPACMYQFSFASLHYGVAPWGEDSGANDMPVNVANLQSFIVTHNITYVAGDDRPGFPDSVYARHSLVYDLFLTTEKPQAGRNVSNSITDEVIIMMNYNPEYPNAEGCSNTKSDPIEADAVFDGFYRYDYQYFSDTNAIGQNYHQFRRIGGEVADAQVPGNLDIAPFLHYLKQHHNQPDLWLGRVTIGTQLYDLTRGSVTFHSRPTFKPINN